MAYNGWKNYETWAVALWIDNEEATYRMRQEWIEEALAGEPKPRTALADRIKEYVEDNNPLGSDSSVYADLMNAALGEIDYYEIAENWLEDVEEEEEE